MKRNSKGELVYVKYGSPRGYECLHCAKPLTPPPNKTIYADPWTWCRDGAGRVRCSKCNNLAERV